MGFGAAVRRRLVTADTIYGTILYTALIAAVSDEDDHALEVLLISAFTLLVFWAAHVFAGIVAGHGGDVALGDATRRSFMHSSGMLLAAIPPTIPLLLGVFDVITTETAVDIALLVATILLGLVGGWSLAERGKHWGVCVLGGLATACFGAVMIVLNVLVH